MDRRWHRLLIMAGLLFSALGALITLGTLIWIAFSSVAPTQAFWANLAAAAQANDVSSVTGHFIRLAMQAAIGIVALLSFYFIVRGKERRGTVLAVVSVVLSLTAVQLITFYLDQFTAVIPTLYQFLFLLLILAYQQWYLVPHRASENVGKI